MTLVIGLTGGIGSGKTTVADQFNHRFGIEIVDADVVAREVVEPGTEGLKAITNKFGEQILTSDGTLDRKKLREVIFSDESAKTWLNELLHPMIRQRMLDQIEQVHSAYCLLVIPLMVENGLQRLANRVLVVDVSELTQINRTMTRDQVSQEQVESILKSQASRAERLAIADDVVNNDGIEPLAEQIEKLHHQYLAMTEASHGE
ncbi:dephospho-CoA kinase [Vibrio ishigakensis]|uniref:Dephospho-CoA kinase n=1 Tax=Vibrio ishigakensis TaxID=1481914 RepID=A0A0B8Q724_9VIBR|nr:dephospho-CoA kinase [Vibrio ishigakensis]